MITEKKCPPESPFDEKDLCRLTRSKNQRYAGEEAEPDVDHDDDVAVRVHPLDTFVPEKKIYIAVPRAPGLCC